MGMSLNTWASKSPIVVGYFAEINHRIGIAKCCDNGLKETA
jgi:hypothetical protein